MTSTAKGRRFENDVAQLYRLQGASVVQNIEINQKKVDILATFMYPVRHRVIVECKDEKRAVNANQRVMQFHGVLDIARQTGDAESAEIVTRVPWGDAAKGFAHKSGIRLMTYNEKLASLIDFTDYLNELIKRFENGDPGRPSEPPLSKCYVDLSAEFRAQGKARRIPIIDSFIHEWIREEDRHRHLAIFGGYGAGKSSLCHKLVHDLAESYLNDPNSNRIPVLLNLRAFVGKLDIDAYITSFLDRECRVANPKFHLFNAMNDAGIFLLVFDGFDEMATKVDADTLESNLIELEKLAVAQSTKVILTSRPEYFISAEEESVALNPSMSIFKNRAIHYEPLKILPWSDIQVQTFLKKRVPLVKGVKKTWVYYRNRIKAIGSLSDLSQRPVLLDMIVKTLPRLIESGEGINLTNLYRTYLIEEIRRQKITKKRTLLLSDKDRLAILEELAVDLSCNTIPSITFTDARVRVEEMVNPPKQDLEAHTRDFLTNSFLVRRGDDYHFSHKSISEYLVGTRLVDEIKVGIPNIFGRTKLSPVVIDFLREISLDTSVLWRWIYSTRMPLRDNLVYVGGNAVTLLRALSATALTSKDLSNTVLTGSQLADTSLLGTDFRHAKLNNAWLYGCPFLRADVSSADISNSLVSFYFEYDKAELAPTDYQRIQSRFRRLDTGSSKSQVYGFRERRTAAGTLIEMVIQVPNSESIEVIRTTIQEEVGSRVAFYFDEYQDWQID